jgi:putative transcriptional regulator
MSNHPPLQNNVHKFRTAAGFTQAELAVAVGVTRQTIIAIEKGNYEPSVRLALHLANQLKVAVEEVFYEESV